MVAAAARPARAVAGRAVRRPQRRSAHRVAVVGGGPSGFYLTKAVLTKLPEAEVDVFDRMPAPFGLARYGVAPDHPEVKAVGKTFERLFEGEPGKEMLHRRRVSFFGNVTVGTGGAIPLRRLLQHYHQVVLATGASADNEVGIPGEAEHCLPARALVEWYNGQPGAPPVDLSGVRNVAVIGNGNVAVDVARVLLAPPALLRPTDIVSSAAAAIADAGVERVSLVARRGVLNAAFTIKEFREMVTLGAADEKKPWYEPDPAQMPWISTEVEGADLCGTAIESLPRPRQRLTKLVMDTEPRPGARRCFSLRFLRRPVEVRADGLLVEVMRDLGDGRVEGTSAQEFLPADLVLKSVGYRGTPLAAEPGRGADPDAPFDPQGGVVPCTKDGRALGEGGAVRPRLYAVGWAKNGARGVILAALSDANAVAAAVAADAPECAADAGCDGQGAAGLGDALAGATSWEDWRALEQYEQEAGSASGKVAEKVTSLEKMLAVITAARSA
eukprot:TRINITY_DN16211_c0_g2_i1.p1 TRINITY_DN16211_c0_g2~~TRINITY_DN16211_c0_g2_i1.p1  ORF type:complete len:499 (+),score=141.48 TRINITY_DN16211_c0_g2_i1:87-1583(+)